MEPLRLRRIAETEASQCKYSLIEADIWVVVERPKCQPNVVNATLTNSASFWYLDGKSDSINLQSVKIDMHN